MANTISWSGVLLLSLFWLQLLCVNGYFIDKSCERIEHKIKLSMHKANESAADALAELNKDNNDDIKELRRWFFRDQDLARVKTTYHFMPYLTKFNEAHTAEVKQPTIYCNLDRFTEEHGELDGDQSARYLINTKEGIVQRWDEGYDGCKAGKTMAYASTIHKYGRKYLDIQLCPWYLNQILGTKFTNAGGSLPDGHGMKNYDPKRQPSKNDPDADVFSSRLDFTLLHELVHALPGGYDIQDDPAYGWHDCIALPQAEGWKNAESYAFFALGVRRIKDDHFKFNREGMIASLGVQNAKRSEQAVMKLWNA